MPESGRVLYDFETAHCNNNSSQIPHMFSNNLLFSCLVFIDFLQIGQTVIGEIIAETGQSFIRSPGSVNFQSFYFPVASFGKFENFYQIVNPYVCTGMEPDLKVLQYSY
jgi:hypothetical protein